MMYTKGRYLKGSRLCTDSGTNLYPQSTTLIAEIESTGVQLKPEMYIVWSIALKMRYNIKAVDRLGGAPQQLICCKYCTETFRHTIF